MLKLIFLHPVKPFLLYSCHIVYLQVVERKRTPAEIREEYERLQKEREERRLQQRTNPKVCSGEHGRLAELIWRHWCALHSTPDPVICREQLVWGLMPQICLTAMKKIMKTWLEAESPIWKSTRCTYHNPSRWRLAFESSWCFWVWLMQRLKVTSPVHVAAGSSHH